MATYSGSGRFVAITANNNGYDYVYEAGMHGITFGNNEDVYCTISPHYQLASDGVTIAGSSLNIESGVTPEGRIDMPLYVGFSALERLDVRGYTGYTGTIRVAHDTTVNYTTFVPTTLYKTYTFKCGLLVGGI